MSLNFLPFYSFTFLLFYFFTFKSLFTFLIYNDSAHTLDGNLCGAIFANLYGLLSRSWEEFALLLRLIHEDVYCLACKHRQRELKSLRL